MVGVVGWGVRWHCSVANVVIQCQRKPTSHINMPTSSSPHNYNVKMIIINIIPSGAKWQLIAAALWLVITGKWRSELEHREMIIDPAAVSGSSANSLQTCVKIEGWSDIKWAWRHLWRQWHLNSISCTANVPYKYRKLSALYQTNIPKLKL